MTPTDCISEDDLVGFVDGALDGDALRSIEAHLATCRACAHLVATLSAEADEEASERSTADDASVGGVLREGTQVGRYRIVRVVGEGAMGRVYAAHDPALDRTVALKLLHPRVATPELELRLEREAKAMARLSHPEVLTVHDAGKHGDQLFIAMELVDGGTLRQWQDASRRGVAEILDVYARAGRGLSRAHEAGLIHRDFKPDNVLIGRDGRVRVTDFGLARADHAFEASDGFARASADDATNGDDALTRTGMLLGTPAYMAPEVAEGAVADARSDLYSFAVSLYEALYGVRPFGGASLTELQRAKRSDAVRSPPRDGQVAPAIRAVLLRALRADPAARFPSMEALLDALAIAATPGNSGRSRIAPGLVGLAIALVAIGGAAMRARSRSARVGSGAVDASRPSAVACLPSRCAGARAGQPFACRPSDDACVAIASEDCTASVDPSDVGRDDLVWIGSMLPLTGPNAATMGRMNAAGVELARREIAEATRAIGGGDAATRVRRIGLVSCDDSADPARAAKHLVEDVGVPAIVGFGSGKALVDLAGAELIPHRVVAMSSLTQNPLVTRIPQPADLPRMIWSTTYDAHQVARAAAKIIDGALLARMPASSTARVAIAHHDQQVGLWVADELFRQLTLEARASGRPVDRYEELSLASVDRARDAGAKVGAGRPAVVVIVADEALAIPFAEAIERSLPRDAARPIYLLDACTTVLFTPFLEASAERRRRVFGICSPSSDVSNARFVVRFNAANAQQVTAVFNPSTSYDAFYAVAYAIFALGDAAPTGPAIARAIGRLTPPGRAIEVGALGIFDALRALESGATIDLHGASGALDFDATTGAAASDFVLVCPHADAQGHVDGDVDSALRYHAANGTIEGAPTCP